MSGALFQRMRARVQGEAVHGEERAVLEHLTLLLNTRQGSSALDAAYGLPDITDIAHNIPAGIPTLQRMIAEAIQRYEPRLRNVAVRVSTHSPEALSLSFEVRAALVHGGVLRFETKVSRGGQVNIF